MKWIIVVWALTPTGEIRPMPIDGLWFKTHADCERVLERDFNKWRDKCYYDARTPQQESRR